MEEVKRIIREAILPPTAMREHVRKLVEALKEGVPSEHGLKQDEKPPQRSVNGEFQIAPPTANEGTDDSGPSKVNCELGSFYVWKRIAVSRRK